MTRSPTAFRRKMESQRRRLRIEPLEDRRLLAVFTVTNLNDSGSGSLREAIGLANNNGGPDEIIFEAGLTGTIRLTSEQIRITDDVAINGPGPSNLTVDADGNSRVFEIDDGVLFPNRDIEIRGLTLSGGVDQNAFPGGHGGAIYSRENLTVVDSTISGNSANFGGGIYVYRFASLTLNNSYIVGNHADNGGGIHAVGELTITDSRITGNLATPGLILSDGFGGGIYAAGNTEVSGGIIDGNSASYGGGIFSRADPYDPLGLAIITDSTISGNSAVIGGGGIRSLDKSLNLTSSTLSGNSAILGGGVLWTHEDLGASPRLDVRYSTITQNEASGDGSGVYARPLDGPYYSSAMSVSSTIISGNGTNDISRTGGVSIPFDSLGFNLIGFGNASADFNASGDQIGVANPRLGPLADNGGPTQTHVPQLGSPAFNLGNPAFAAPPNFDQRGAGFDRVRLGAIDIGAVEVQEIGITELVVDTITDENDGNLSPGDLSLREAIEFADILDIESIGFDPSLTGQTIALTLGQLDIQAPVAIQAPTGGLTLDAEGNSRIFNIDDGVAGNHINVTLDGLTLTGGDVVGVGGAIRSTENLTLSSAVVTGNTATGAGGGIYARNTDFYGRTYISNTTVTGNRTTGNLGAGGGFYFRTAGAFASISGSTFAGNTTVGYSADGGGLSVLAEDATVVVSGSSISGNTVAGSDGGGMYFNASGFGAVLVQESTISANIADRAFSVGGGLFAVTSDYGLGFIVNSTVSENLTKNHGGGVALAYGSEVEFLHTTITGNTSDADSNGSGQGGGLFLDLTAVARLKHTIVAANTDQTGTAPDVRKILGTLTPTFSLVGDNRGSGLVEANPDGNGNIIGGPVGGTINPGLGPLDENGGSTLTHELLVGSPAIDAGDPNISSPPEFDQRGEPFTRIYDGRIDIGAFELQPILPDCDFDQLNGCDIDDIDALVVEIVSGANNPLFDLTGDGVVDLGDRDQWLTDAGALNLPSGNSFLLGDSNLDGVVDGQDFIIWNGNKFMSTGQWSQADWNADGVTDGQDFIIWNGNKFQSSDAAAQPVFRPSREHMERREVWLSQTLEQSVVHAQPIPSVAIRRIEAVFAGSRQFEERTEERPQADVFDAFFAASPLNSWGL